MDGFEVARRLKGEPRLAGVRLVALTGFGQEEDRRQSLAAGFDHHMVKPVDMKALREVLLMAPSPNGNP
jgi:CheY-like chemotaxis protein